MYLYIHSTYIFRSNANLFTNAYRRAYTFNTILIIMPFGLLHHYSFYAYIFAVAVVFVGMKTSKSNLFSCEISMYKPNTFFVERKKNFFLFDTYTRSNHHYLLRIEHLNSSVSWIHSTLHYCIRFKSRKSFIASVQSLQICF